MSPVQGSPPVLSEGPEPDVLLLRLVATGMPVVAAPSQSTPWSRLRALSRLKKVSADPGQTTSQGGDSFFGSLADFEADLRAGDGNELEGKFRAVHSSSALAVNVFAPFRSRGSELILPGSGSITGLEFERKCPHGVSRRAPNLDVLLTGPAGFVGIESKLTEPLSRHRAVFSPKYRERIQDERRESAWFKEMLALEDDPKRYAWLDAVQLVKHAFGLAHTFPDGALTLLYLYREPRNAERFPLFIEHRGEIDAFSRRVAGSRPSFRTMTYPELWRTWSQAPPSWLTVHLDALRARYEVEI